MQGKTWKFKDNVDTDLIIPARYLNTHDPAELAKHCMEDADPAFASKVSKGDFIVVGENFGCGSSREHAPVAIKAAGVSAVIAKSFARIFFRNAINIGLPILEIKETDEIKEGDLLDIDIKSGTIKDMTSGKTFKAEPFPPFMQKLIDAGGLISYVKSK
ncbi:MAG: 3-isopropylmalate dehydratase small subunit [Candidatus Margulisiibacteriota bacterium]